MINKSTPLAIGLTVRITKLVPGLVFHYFEYCTNHYFLIVSDHRVSDLPLGAIHDIVEVFTYEHPGIGYLITEQKESIPSHLEAQFVVKNGELKSYGGF